MTIEEAAKEYATEITKPDDLLLDEQVYTPAVVYMAAEMGFLAGASFNSDAVDRPKIVCLCGSTRFMKAFQKANLELTLNGIIVLSVGCNTKSDVGLGITEEKKIELDELHKRKIDLADEILVLNVDGYIGSSTRSEIQYAEKNNKPIKYLEQNSDHHKDYN